MSLGPGPYDLLIEGGLVFDGRGNAPRRLSVGIRGGRIADLFEPSAAHERPASREVVSAHGQWVMPGFIDFHTHYDAEVEVAPSLSESLRHGVTTVFLGSCSLSLAVGSPDELADMYCRVEALPDEVVRPLLRAAKTWEGHAAYYRHLDALPLGPNVASFVGHSALRANVMGIERSLERGVVPTAQELSRMRDLVGEGLDEGYVGLSIQTLPWDKMGGTEPYRSRPLPSTFARWSEYRALLQEVRARGRVFQGVPNVSTKVNALLFMLESVPLFDRKPLKTTIISMMDLVGERGIHRVIGALARFVNSVMGGDFRWQALPEPFDLWADGLDLVVFEEFGAGAAALHLADPDQRSALLRDPEYRARFRREWRHPLLPRAFHRNLALARVLSSPDASLAGKTFAEIAKDRGRDAVDVFLDLVATHGTRLRWTTMMANDREGSLLEIIGHPDVLIGFSDAGAHLRQMAHYSFPLRMLRRVQSAHQAARPAMSLERAVHRLTGEIASWFGIAAGHLEVGARADVVVVDPAGLTDRLEDVCEAVIEGFGAHTRLVRRSEDATTLVVVGGRVASRRGVVEAAVGRERGFGRVLRAL